MYFFTFFYFTSFNDTQIKRVRFSKVLHVGRVLILGTWEAEPRQFSEDWTFCLMLPSTTTGTAFKTLAIISLIFFKQEHFYPFQELSTYPVSFHPSSIIFFTSKKKKYTFRPLPVKMKCPTPLTLKWFPAVQENMCITHQGKQHPGTRGKGNGTSTSVAK